MTFTTTEVIIFLIALSVALTIFTGVMTLIELKNLPEAGAEIAEYESRREHEKARREASREA